jgi:hypothetical protein
MLEALDLRHVRVPVDDHLAVGEPGRQPGLAPEPGPGIVDHPDLDIRDLDDPLPRQAPLQRLIVHVPVDPFHRRPERAQLFQKRRGHEVAAVEDEVRCGDPTDTFVR